MNEQAYLLDGQPVGFVQLIEAAKPYGLAEDSFIFRTSEAAHVLRDNGHTVENNPIAQTIFCVRVR